MGALDYLKEFEGRVLDAKSYQLLRRNYELQEENTQLLSEKIKHLENEVSALQRKNEQLTTENKGLLERVKEFEAKEKYEIYKGIAFKVNQNGEVELTPYCPNCEFAMSDAAIGIYKCPKCGYVARPKTRVDILAKELQSRKN